MVKVGKYELFTVNFGFLKLDGGAMFGVVPKVLWEKTNPADERNRITLAMRGLIIKSNDAVVLVDNGAGDKGSAKFNDIYGIETMDPDEALKEKGLTINDITHVVITHLHFDHCGGSTKVKDDTVVPTFPNATYYINSTQYTHALHPLPRDRASFLPANYEPLKSAGVLELKDGPFELLPGVEIFISNGHTPGQQLVRIKGDDHDFIYVGDLIPTSSHVPIPYVMSYDLYPVTTMDEKEKLLKEAAEKGHVLIYEHDPFVSATTVVMEKGRFKKGEVIDL